jgi:hypothetical protein
MTTFRTVETDGREIFYREAGASRSCSCCTNSRRRRTDAATSSPAWPLAFT